jgi:DNA-binding NarL/FixJ family response regulator
MNIKVILFEDNPSLRDGLFQLINGTHGFTCVGALPNCDDLIHQIEKLKPDVVLMDIEMPGMNGIEAVRIIKEKHPQIKVLMETIFDDDEKIFKSICAGAEGYILKHTEPDEIISAIREIQEGGSPMTPSIANRVLKMVRDKNPNASENAFNLTHREKEILSCLVKGMSYKMVANHCAISTDTVNAHIRNIYKKLQVNSKSEAVVKAIRGKII